MSTHREVSIMNYSLGEELVSSISHGIGTGLSIAGAVLCIVKAASAGNFWGTLGVTIYGISLIMLYCMSTIYHALAKNKAKKVFRVIDHCGVFFLIAGTYTPFLLVSLRSLAGWIMFICIWALAIVGIVFNAIDVDKYEKLSAIINVLMGWTICLMFRELSAAIGPIGLTYLIVGGVIYTLGAILYAIGDNVRYMHSIWHFFVLGGSICHFFSIYISVI